MIVSLKCKWWNYQHQGSRRDQLHLNRSLGYRTHGKHKSLWKLFLMHEFHPTIHKTKTTHSPWKEDSLKQKIRDIVENHIHLADWGSRWDHSFMYLYLKWSSEKESSPHYVKIRIQNTVYICVLFTSCHLHCTLYGGGYQTIKLYEQPMIWMIKNELSICRS